MYYFGDCSEILMYYFGDGREPASWVGKFQGDYCGVEKVGQGRRLRRRSLPDRIGFTSSRSYSASKGVLEENLHRSQMV